MIKMSFSNSPLVVFTRISPNRNPRQGRITKITPHYVAGNLTVESIGNVFAPSSRQASSNYGIDSNGRVGMYVEEKDRAWTSSSAANDNAAVTIEVSNINANGEVTDKAWNALIDLCVDICRRNPGIVQANGQPGLNFTDNANGNLTMHQWFSATLCPGNWLKARFAEIARLVNARLAAPVAPPTPPPTYPISDANIQSMVDLGIIGSPEYWRNKVNIQHLDALMNGVAKRALFMDSLSDFNITDADRAIQLLSAVGIISSPAYWLRQLQDKVDPYLPQLLINMAKWHKDALQ
jgi:hypothetical protein